MTLYCVAPEERMLKRNQKSEEGLRRAMEDRGLNSNIERKLFT